MESIMSSAVTLIFIKCAVMVLVLLNVPPVMLIIERRGSGLMQDRLGPNRLGPLGIFQPIADAIKFIFKEDRVPGHVKKGYYLIAPVVAVIPAMMAFAVVPVAAPVVFPNGQEFTFQVTSLDTGLLYVFAITSLSVYGIIIAGWSSNSKYSLFGALRSANQMISYELSLTLSIVGVLMAFSSVQLSEIALQQTQTWFALGPIAIPKLGILIQPLGFLIFLVAIFAETNRLPFDMAEGESEIIAGYHLEYGGLKFGLFFLAEYVNMFTAAALAVTLFLGGWQMFPPFPQILEFMNLSGMDLQWTRAFFQIGSFMTKVLLIMWLFVWVRWTAPRFRYDQVMDLGWKVLLPLGCANIFITGILIYYGVI